MYFYKYRCSPYQPIGNILTTWWCSISELSFLRKLSWYFWCKPRVHHCYLTKILLHHCLWIKAPVQTSLPPPISINPTEQLTKFTLQNHKLQKKFILQQFWYIFISTNLIRVELWTKHQHILGSFYGKYEQSNRILKWNCLLCLVCFCRFGRPCISVTVYLYLYVTIFVMSFILLYC